jgi:pantoate--beta-alanine ligase
VYFDNLQKTNKLHLKIIKTKSHLSHAIQMARENNATIGFVPTMGALHQGHTSLISASKSDGHYTIASVFINPTQFNSSSDFDKYPRVPERDLQLLYEANCDVVFMPTTEEMYEPNETTSKVDYGIITHSLEGAFRPGHFDGVVAIVKKLFETTQPDVAYFGLKDYQQCMVIKKMVEHHALQVCLKFMPTIREKSGLAMSSRNSRLNHAQLARATSISKILHHIAGYIEKHAASGVDSIIEESTLKLNAELKTEYIAIRLADTFEAVHTIQSGQRYVVLVAAWCDDVRLIDNIEAVCK